MVEETYHAMLVAKKEGIYTVFVFKKDDGGLILCTKLPNWGPYLIKIGEEGFVTTQFFKAGEEYFDRESQTNKIIQYTNVYFKEFVSDSSEIENVVL